jgi:hypothetical protein
LNILFLTQSKTLSVFYDIVSTLRKRAEVERVGFYIADSSFFDKFKKINPEICSGKFELLKEWEIIEKSRNIKPDIERLREYEKKLGDPFLWNALIADRRIYLGKRAMLEQDYNSRFDHESMLAILQTGLSEMEGIFDRVQPDVVVGFICVTIGEYLAYLIAKSKNIPFLNLRPTRIKNYFFAGESVLEPSEQLGKSYRQMLVDGVPEHLKQEVISYLSGVRRTHAMYEGVLPPHKRTPDRNDRGAIREIGAIILNLGSIIKGYYDYNFGRYRHDNHYRGIFYRIWFKRVKKPVRIKYTDFFLRRYYVDANKLASMDYAFYPLHKEPEVTLLVYGRPYLNQIEVVRNLARSLPVGMKLVVKEHPVAVGYHPLSYYRKLLAIPNVMLAPPGMTSRELVQNAKLVFIISGSVGLEAIMMKKPVVYFGNIPFSVLPDSMIRHVKNLNNLSWEIHDIMDNHNHDENALIAYLSAVITSSVPVDFYSVLLGRKGVYNPDVGAGKNENEYHKQIERLSLYLINRIKTYENNL